MKKALVITMAVLTVLAFTWAGYGQDKSKMENVMRIVDLTHPITLDMPIWPGDPLPEINTLATVEEDWYLLNQLAIGEHSGTHFGVPAHFMADGLTAEAVPPEVLIAPGVVVDVRASSAENPDYALTVKDIMSWEAEHGPVPAGSYVLALTGWGEKWSDPAQFFGFADDDSMHFPGFSEETVIFLMEERNVLGLGIDTHGIDPGMDEDFLSNTALFERGGYHLENLANLDHLPARGFTLFIGLLPISRGSGSPARVLARFADHT